MLKKEKKITGFGILTCKKTSLGESLAESHAYNPIRYFKENLKEEKN